jgi:hypothetical protein
MATMTAEQRRKRERVERLIRLMAPGLSLILNVGERVSRIVEPEDQEYYPIRSGPSDSGDDAARARRA